MKELLRKCWEAAWNQEIDAWYETNDTEDCASCFESWWQAEGRKLTQESREGTFRVEFHMTNPPKPIALHCDVCGAIGPIPAGAIGGNRAGWIPVEERLPEPLESGYARTVLAADKSGQNHIAYWDGNEWCVYHMCCHYNGPVANITHWMPLPEGPT